MRYEEPNEMNRWDAPLITIQQDDETPCEAIADALFKRKALTTNFANVTVRSWMSGGYGFVSYPSPPLRRTYV